MLQKFKESMRRFLAGRYGSDALGYTLMGVGLALLLLSNLLPMLVIPSYLLLIFYIYRCYSRQIAKRRSENTRFLAFFRPLTDRSNRYFRCPHCRQTVRVPRGKGRIRIHCPQCRTGFEKTT